MTDLPTWALEEAVKRLNAEGGPAGAIWRSPNDHISHAVITVARLIAKYEKEPVDPIHAEAVELVVNIAQPMRTKNQIQAIREGHAGENLILLAESALRRGIEMAGGL